MNVSDKEDLFDALVANQDFRDWVLNPTEARNEYWEKWIAEDKDKQLASLRARNAIFRLNIKEEFLDDDRLESILTDIISGEPSDQVPSELSKKPEKRYLLAAACIVVLVFVAVLINLNLSDEEKVSVVERHVSNTAGKKSKLKLPDGSLVYLNAKSSLTFPEHFEGSDRVVTLSGEAYFSVVKNENKPFLVKSGDLVTKVLGTEFNVRAFESDDRIDIALVEGRVEVEGIPDLEEKMVLHPGEKLTFQKRLSAHSKSEFTHIKEVGWKQGILVFEDASFDQFIAHLERWYDVVIQVKGRPSDTWRVNGEFDNDSLEEVLLGVQFTYGMDYVIDGKQVTLTSK